MDDHDRTVLDRVDGHLDPLVPTAPAPVADLVRRGRAARTRRRGLRAGLAAAVAVVAAATTTAVVQGRDSAAPPVAPSTSAPVGDTRTVGLDGIVVDVPGDWVSRDDCSPTPDATVFAPESVPCGTEQVTLQVGPILTFDERPEPVEQNGLEVVRRIIDCSQDVACGAGVVSYLGLTEFSIGGLVSVFGPERESVAASVRALPDGSVVVPDVEGLGLDEAKQVMEDAGLETGDEEPLHVVGATDPEAGSVVPLGSDVYLPPAVASEDTRTIGLDDLVLDVPADWVETGVRTDPPIDGDVRGVCNPSGVAYGAPGSGERCRPTAYVEVDRLDVSERQGGEPFTQGGLDLRRRTDVCPPNATCVHGGEWTTVWVDGQPLGVTLVTRGDDALLERIVASLRPLPEGQVVVPLVSGEVLPEAAVVLTDAGLVPSGPQGDDVVATSDPGTGSVVPAGSTVTLAPLGEDSGAAPEGTQEIGYDGVTVSVPVDWVGCPVPARIGIGPSFAYAPPGGDACGGTDVVSMQSGNLIDVDDFTSAPERDGVRSLPTGAGPGVRLLVDGRVVVRINASSSEVVDAIVASVRVAD